MGNSAGALITCYLGHAKKLKIRSIFPTQQPKGTPLLLPLFRSDGPAVMVYNRSGKGDKIHHPDFAIMVRERCKELGVRCLAYGVRGTGLKTLSDGESIHDLAMQFFQKSWKKKSINNQWTEVSLCLAVAWLGHWWRSRTTGLARVQGGKCLYGKDITIHFQNSRRAHSRCVRVIQLPICNEDPTHRI